MCNRDKFEAWYKSKWPLDDTWQWHENEHRYTRLSSIQWMWESWLASNAATLPPTVVDNIVNLARCEAPDESDGWDLYDVGTDGPDGPWEAGMTQGKIELARQICDELGIEYGR